MSHPHDTTKANVRAFYAAQKRAKEEREAAEAQARRKQRQLLRALFIVTRAGGG